MPKTLVVVESPNKVAKITSCLGAGYKVVATLGHFRDLPEKELGVDLLTFTPSYQVMPQKAGVIARIREAARAVDAVLLATDADREGEAIAWHVAQAVGLKNAKRVRFRELTPSALKKAVAAAGPLDQHLVDAQQARRVLDRLVGYQVSPLLSQFGPHHSAGRVQSAALHLVVERETARDAFRPQPYWTVQVDYAVGFKASAAGVDAKGTWGVTRFQSMEDAERVVADARAHPHTVESLEVKAVDRPPRPPFTTATLQQAASAQLGLKPDETMALAQALFEKGAITYHRTDSVALSDEALEMARAFLAVDYPQALPEKPVAYRNQDSAQEAHEAIRPTAMELAPDIRLERNEELLLSVINRRFLASQCRPARLEVTTVRTVAGGRHFVAKGTVTRFESFLRYVAEDETTAAARHEETYDEERALPPLENGQRLELAQVGTRGEKSKPPPRFTQATLVRELQRSGIGRPSTYASTVTLLFERRYLQEEGKAVCPTARGRLVDGALSLCFGTLVATNYTAEMEGQLDRVAEGQLKWKEAVARWYRGFSTQLAAASPLLDKFAALNAALIEEGGESSKRTGKKCPRCSQELLLRRSTKGAFLGCSAWPTCDYRADPSARDSTMACPKCTGGMVEQEGKYGRYAKCVRSGCDGQRDLSVVLQEKCPLCQSALRDKGLFLGCSSYPQCGFTVDAKSFARARRAGTHCPKCSRLMVQRKSTRGPFWACIGYPECRETAALRSGSGTP